MKDKNRTTATKPLPKPVSRRMYAIVGRRNVINAKNLFHTLVYADVVAARHGQRSVPVLVTVTPIRAKRAGGRGAAGEGKRGRGA